MKLSAQDIKEILAEIRNEMIRNKDLLCQLDGIVGDGDLGITMATGFSMVVETLALSGEDRAGALLYKAGTVMSSAAPSTMGTLVATAMMKAGKEVNDADVIGAKDFVKMGHAAIKGIQQRGKAVQGEKTLLDSLIPAVEAIDNWQSEGKGIKEIFRQAYSAAGRGVEATKAMKAVHGRAKWYGDKSFGKQDPGATACMLIFKGMLNWAEMNETM